MHVLAFLRSPAGSHFRAIFWDFGCVPEPDADGYMSDADRALQKQAFEHSKSRPASDLSFVPAADLNFVPRWPNQGLTLPSGRAVSELYASRNTAVVRLAYMPPALPTAVVIVVQLATVRRARMVRL